MAWPNGMKIAHGFRLIFDAVELTIYTPASNAGVPITVLRSFAARPKQCSTMPMRSAND